MSSPVSPFHSPMDLSGRREIPIKKRRKGATRLSCAECRRLKLRCDRTIPCGSCVKRGCGAICPEGSLTTGQGNRFVLASTQELHEKISELSTRVRELEDGLKNSHAKMSTESHPLLSEELLKIKMPLQREPPALRNGSLAVKEEENPQDALDAFGSLSISLSGRTKYFGHNANSWLFLRNELPEDENTEESVMNLNTLLPQEILARASALPIASTFTLISIGIQALCWYLPPPEAAHKLRSIYYSHAAWMYHPINIEAFDEEVSSLFYGQHHAAILGEEPIMYHRLSLMFMVLAIGSLMDMSLPAYNVEAEKYHQLARAALFHSSLFEEPTLNAVQSLFLMTHYMFLADRHGTNTEARWGIMGITIKVAQSIGLHRDSGKWKVEDGETQRRRELFWELFTYDSWQCYTFGRPPSFALAHIDTKMPFLDDHSDEHAYHAWKHRFSSECMNIFHDQAFGAKTPNYATVLQLDRKMRSFPVPPILQVVGFGSSELSQTGQDSLRLTLQRHIVLAIREGNLLYLHRSFFARAMSDHPSDPLSSPYGTSVIAAYRSAGSSIALLRNLHNQLKETSERMWFLWTHMFSSAIVLGSIVTRCPSMSFALSALGQLDSACELFSKAARGFHATKVLNIMLNLQQKAHYSLEEYRKGNGSMLTRLNTSDAHSPVEDDELAVLGGQTRYVKPEPASPRIIERSPISQNPVIPLPLPSTLQDDSVNPQLVHYLQSFQSGRRPVQASASFSDMHTLERSYSEEISPSSMYGLSTIPGTSTFQQEPVSYIQDQQQQQQHQHALQQHRQQQQQQQQAAQNVSQPILDIPGASFPQYFPVYDYSSSTINGFGHSPLMENAQPPQVPQPRRSSGSPDSNMQTTWQDFVNTLTI